MKVQEIISEANVFQLIGKGLQGAAKYGSKEAELAKDASKVYHGVTDAEKGAGYWGQQAGKINAAGATKTAAAAEREAMAFVTKHYSKEVIDLFKSLNFYMVLTEYGIGWYKNYSQFQIDHDQAKYDAAMKQLGGICIAQWIAPKVANLVASVTGAKKIASVLPGIMKLLGFKNAAVITKSLGNAAFQTALISFFMLPAGREWLTNTFGKLIGVLGEIPDLGLALMKGVGDIAQGGYNMATGKDQLPGPQADAGSKQDQGATSDATGAAQAPSDHNSDDTGFVQNYLAGKFK
jgi:hypothetical protein